VIPVFIEDHDDPDKVLNSSPFKKVWAVINALRSHDGELGEQLDQFRQALGKRGSVGRPDKIIFDMPTTISCDFEESLNAKMVISTTSSWEHWFGLLECYREEFGNCAMNQRDKYNGAHLGVWVSIQRMKKDQLTFKKINRLEGLGFIWDFFEYQWEENFKDLIAYKAKFDNVLVPLRYKTESGTNRYRSQLGSNLGLWVSSQRKAQDILTADQRNRLDAFGFVWDVLEYQWDEGFEHLVSYKKEFGDCLVTYSFKSNDYNLGHWVGSQRSKKDQLTPDQFTRLDDLGLAWVWDAKEERWLEGLKLLVSYKEEFGHSSPPLGLQYQGFSLGQWCSTQRQSKKELTPERLNSLDALGFVLDPFQSQWEEGFTHLVAYKKEFDHCRPPNSYKYDGYGLGNWVSNQRKKQGSFTSDQRNRLDELGFVWDVNSYVWLEGFQWLVSYKEEFGHCRVPVGLQYHGYNLGSWVSTKRATKDKLTTEKVNLLTDLGFVWKVQ
jgi:hypothetical protein